ncbi:hypothetical protein [Clostridium estertheticum]|uniref:hypothetical protein n=1 Tax=Clostridium estertheticum TaxID=238834 RepID=UPI001C0CA7B4|nr:hypothetical protein [Clostridium estertheticum]MBU3075615.1 hypothetical protein [Clostridium estertheticum]MBU3164803.1 hypothetical protein [Clostridium estertheticum]
MGEDTLFEANKFLGIILFNNKFSDYLEREKSLLNDRKTLYDCDDIKRIVTDIINESTLEDFKNVAIITDYDDCDIPY